MFVNTGQILATAYTDTKPDASTQINPKAYGINQCFPILESGANVVTRDLLA